MAAYEHILVSTTGAVGLIQLNRPKVLNALSPALMAEVADALRSFDADATVRAIVLHGNERAFAAGADIGDMAEKSVMDVARRDYLGTWGQLRNTKKPIIAAVSGFAFGGGCELAMSCDMIVASETAQFGQPEINLGIMPGAGGTQRLTRALGKALAMEMVLTGRPITAARAYEAGLVNRVVPVERYLQEAVRLAREIAGKAPVAVELAKEAVLKAFDTNLPEGMEFERKNFFILFSTDDQKEGMNAFIEKRKPEWKGR